MDPNMLKKMALIITIVSSPIIYGFSWATFAFYHEVGFKADTNIILSYDQQLFIMQIILSSFLGLSLLSCLLFTLIFNNEKINNTIKHGLNMMMLSLVTATFVICYQYFPQGPQAFIIPVQQDHGGVKIFEGLSSNALSNTSSCYVSNQTFVVCGEGEMFKIEFVPNILENPNFENNTLKIFDAGEEYSIETFNGSGSFKVLPTNMKKDIKEELEAAECLTCNNPDSNRCRNLIYEHQPCESYCQKTPIFLGNFSLEEVRLHLKGENMENSLGWENEKVNVEKSGMNIKEVEIYCKSPKYFFNRQTAQKCQSNEFDTECLIAMVKCSGNGKWLLEPENLECRQPRDEKECQNISGYYKDGECLGRPASDEECQVSGQGDLYDGHGHCLRADGKCYFMPSV